MINKSKMLVFAAICAVLMVGFTGIPKTMAINCPYGYNHVVQDLNYAGYWIHVEFCVECGFAGPTPVTDITEPIWYLISHCDHPEIFDTWDFKEWFRTQVLLLADQACHYPSCSVMPDQRTIVTIHTPMCYKYHNYPYVDNGVNKHTLLAIPCADGATCLQTFRVCRDYATSELFYYPANIGLPENLGSCLPDPPATPPVGLTWDQEWETPCFVKESCPPSN